MALTLHGTVSDNTVALDRKTATPLIINGDIQIAQRGTSVSGLQNSPSYLVDRWSYRRGGAWSTTSFTYSQLSSTGLAYFDNAARLAVTGTETPSSSTFAGIEQVIEGYNITNLNWGTSDAKTVTLSFWVRSSLTGTFSGYLLNGSIDAAFVYEYTILSANTWEYKTITIPGDTTKTWSKTNGVGIRCGFVIAGDTSGIYSTSTINEWIFNSDKRYSTNQTNLAGTSGATFDITGVQLEVGTFDANSIPPFQFEDRATSLARCQRYCYQEDNSDTFHNQVHGFFSSSTLFIGLVALPVALRSTPTLVTSGSYVCAGISSLSASSLIIVDSTGTDLTKIQVRATVSGATAGQGTTLRNDNDANAIFRLDSEL